MAFNIPKGLQQLHGKKSTKPEAGSCKSLPRAAFPLEDVLHGQANSGPFLTYPLVPEASALGHSAEVWAGCCQQTARLTTHYHCLRDFFSGVPLLPGPCPPHCQNLRTSLEDFQKAAYAQKASGEMGMSLVVAPCSLWGSLSPQPDLVLVPHSAGVFKNTLSPRRLPRASICAEVENRKLFQKEVGINLNTRIFGPFDYLQTDSCIVSGIPGSFTCC